MKKIYSMKKVLLVAAALFACNTMFAQLTETFAQSSGATKDAAITGTSYTIPGTYNAGGGSNKAGTMPSNGVKLRTGQDGGKVEFLVNKPYTIAALEIEAIANDVGVDPEIPAITVTSDDHEWNEVYLEGNWYIVDATWDDGDPGTSYK